MAQGKEMVKSLPAMWKIQETVTPLKSMAMCCYPENVTESSWNCRRCLLVAWCKNTWIWHPNTLLKSSVSNVLTWKFYEIGGLYVIISVGAPGVFLGISICILVETPLEKHLLFRSLPFFQILPLSLIGELGALLYKVNWAKEGESFPVSIWTAPSSSS